MKKMSRMAACVYAQINGYFWLPCPVCGEEFGGHEWRDRGGHASAIPDEPYASGGTGICPNCTISGTGCYVHARLRGVAYHDCEHTLKGLVDRQDGSAPLWLAAREAGSA